MTGPLPYIGGKNRLAKHIIPLIPDHVTYVEPFAGGAQVLFHKQPSAVEVLNDLNFDVVNFFRVCQWHSEELIRYLRYALASRTLHQLHLATNPDTLTDIQRAGRFFYLQKNSFDGLVLRQTFHYSVTQNSNFNPERVPEIIEQTRKRLARVQVECLPYEQVLEKYDRLSTFFYLDPPYWRRKLYQFNFRDEDFLGLERRLGQIKGKFLLSLDDHPKIRDIFRAFSLREMEISYSAKRGAGHRYGELFITNFEINSE
jgi:DNA adenine methylase